MKIERAIFSYIEHELYYYTRSKRKIDQLRDEILYSSSSGKKEIKADCGLSDSTAAKASLLISSPSIAKIEKTIRDIEDALKRLDETHNQLFHLKYIEGKNYLEVCDLIPLGKTTYFRKRKELVAMVGWYMGLVSDIDLS